MCFFTLKYWASTWSFLPNTLYIIRLIQQVWAWAARPISPSRSGCGRKRWWFTSLLTPALDVSLVLAALGIRQFLLMSWTCPCYGKPATGSVLVMSAAVQDSGLPALRHQSIHAPPGCSLQHPWPMLDIQSFPRLPKVHRAKKKQKNQGNSSRDGFIPRGLDSAKVNGFLRRPTLVTLNHSLKQ